MTSAEFVTASRNAVTEVQPRQFGLIVGGILGIQVVIAILIATQGTFFADDLLFMRLSRDEPMGWDYVSRSAFGHLTPAYMMLIRAYDRVFGLAYWPAIVIMLSCLALGAVALLRVFIELAGRSRATLVLFALAALSPVFMISVTWFAMSMTAAGGFALGVATFGSALRWNRTGRHRHLFSVILTFAGSLAFWEKGLLVPAYLGAFVLALAWCHREPWRSLLRWWPVFAALTAVALIHLSIYIPGNYADEAGIAPSASEMAAFLARSAVSALMPAVFGFRHDRVLLPWPLVVAATATVVLVTVAWSSLRNRRALAAWAFAAVAILGNQVVLGRGRISHRGTGIGYDFRYQYDSLMLLLTAAALAFGLKREAPVRRPLASKALWAGTAGLAMVWAVGSVPTLTSYWDFNPGRTARAYFENFENTFEPEQVTGLMLDGYVKAPIIAPEMYPYNLWSVIGPLWFDDLPMTTSSNDARIVADDGKVVPGYFHEMARARPVQATGTCEGGEPAPTTFLLPETLGGYPEGLYVRVDVVPSMLDRSVQVKPIDDPAGLIDVTGLAVDTAVPAGQDNVTILISNRLAERPDGPLTVVEPAAQPMCVLGVAIGVMVPK